MPVRWLMAVLCLIQMVGCKDKDANKPTEWDYTPILPIYCIEEYPDHTIYHAFEKPDTIVHVEYDKALILPLYRDLLIDSHKYKYVLRNPFVVKSTDDLEAELEKRGQREKLKRVIIWIPGYLPASIPSSFRYEWPVAGKKRTFIELHKENKENGSPVRMTAALKKLLCVKEFVVGNYVDTIQEYDPGLLVTAQEYGSQYRDSTCLRGVRGFYVLWAFDPGMKIKISLDTLSREEVMGFLDIFLKQVPASAPAERSVDK